MTDKEKSELINGWMEVGKSVNLLILGALMKSADAEGMVNKETFLAAVTAIAGSMSSFIRAISTESMPVANVRDLMVSAIDSFLQEDIDKETEDEQS